MATEVATNIPVSNTGKIRLEVRKLPGGPSSFIPPKASILIDPGVYEVIAHPPAANPIVIANINYAIQGFKVVPTNLSVKDARFAVYVNLSEK